MNKRKQNKNIIQKKIIKILCITLFKNTFNG